jgi:hypothetical protein
MFAKIESYRKAVVALVASAGTIWAVVAAADLSTKAGVYGMIAALVTAVSTYAVPNKPTP